MRLIQTAFLPQHIQRGTQRTRMRLDPRHASLAPEFTRLPPFPSRPLIPIEDHEFGWRRHRQRWPTMHSHPSPPALPAGRTKLSQLPVGLVSLLPPTPLSSLPRMPTAGASADFLRVIRKIQSRCEALQQQTMGTHLSQQRMRLQLARRARGDQVRQRPDSTLKAIQLIGRTGGLSQHLHFGRREDVTAGDRSPQLATRTFQTRRRLQIIIRRRSANHGLIVETSSH
jgi:hypothetical protein